MWFPKAGEGKKSGKNGLVGVAVDKDKGSQYALKWAVENMVSRGQTLVLIHVNKHSSSTQSAWNPFGYMTDGNNSYGAAQKCQLERQTKDLFLAFHCFCTRKDIQCHDVTLDHNDVAKAITEYASYAAIENLILGASSRGFLRKFKSCDIPGSVSRVAPDFCTVYIISKGKISSVRNALRPAPFSSPLYTQIQNEARINSATAKGSSKYNLRDDRISSNRYGESFRGRYNNRHDHLLGDSSESESDISFASSGGPSTDHIPGSLGDATKPVRTPRLSTTASSEQSLGYSNVTDDSSMHDFSRTSIDSGGTSGSSEAMDEAEAEMRRLKLELKQTMEMYSTACREALTAKQKAIELRRWRLEEERKLEEARLAEEAALAIAEKERAKCRAAMEAAEAHQRIAELEAQKRMMAEMKALREAEDMRKMMGRQELRCRKYSIEDIEAATDYFAESRKIGEGGYGPVYKCYLDNTPVAIKVLRPDAAQGRSQFQQEVEVLSCIRHPNMVLLLGACPEYGCLVYEYMANGSLDDRLFQRGKTPALSWQLRFRIAAEIATGLLFLHQTKPEPIVHRDLKPGNILLDHNFVSKISDVGLARLVPANVADNVTQYRMTSTAGTFCYIDPEYQQTGMLGVKSDVYSLGIMLLQIITAKVPMGLAHSVEMSIENGTFADMLDPAVPDWPLQEATSFANLALRCSELRRKDRPDLGQVVLPELNKLRSFAGETVPMTWSGSSTPSPNHSQVSPTAQPELISDP
uniref:RING-type E3 ubiquitin transferase n=1 Tax=Kalanchoe fedtschenkoi TaxID=63787 RepID=A0A7N0V3E9_KALFE